MADIGGRWAFEAPACTARVVQAGRARPDHDRHENALIHDQQAALAAANDPALRHGASSRPTCAFRHPPPRAFVGNREMSSLEPRYRRRVRALRGTYETAFRAVIDEGCRSGKFTVGSARLASFAIVDMGIRVAAWFRVGGEAFGRRHCLCLRRSCVAHRRGASPGRAIPAGKSDRRGSRVNRQAARWGAERSPSAGRWSVDELVAVKQRSGESVGVVIPARDEEARRRGGGADPRRVDGGDSAGGRLVVMDSLSSDGTQTGLGEVVRWCTRSRRCVRIWVCTPARGRRCGSRSS